MAAKTRIFLLEEPNGNWDKEDSRQTLFGMSFKGRGRIAGRYTARGNVSITPSEWTVVDPGFDMNYQTLFSNVDAHVQFKTLTGWSDSIFLRRLRFSFFSTLCKQIRVKAITSSGRLNYILGRR